MRRARCETGERDPPDHRSSGHLRWLSDLIQTEHLIERIAGCLDTGSPDFIRIPAGRSSRDHALGGVAWEGSGSDRMRGWMAQLSFHLSFLVAHGGSGSRNCSWWPVVEPRHYATFAPWVSPNFRLQLLQSLRDSPMKRRIQRLIALASRGMEIERVTRALGIVALRGELLLAQLEGARDFESGHDPQKYGAGILRQFFAQLAPQSREVEFRAHDQRGHSRAALGARHGDPVHRDVEDIAAPGECRGNLRGRDVLTLPAERVADPIDEVIEPLLVAAHEVTGPVPRVARREDIAQHFAAARLGVGIAFEPCAAAA